jgi:hypothetical protein
MEIAHNGVPEGSDRFDHVEDLLSRYPAIAVDEVETLKRWFNKEASAFDVASLASIEGIHASYAAFRAEILEREIERQRVNVFVELFAESIGA